MTIRSRRRRLAVINRRWSLALVAAVVAVVAGVVGIVTWSSLWVYAGLVLAVGGALGAMLLTLVRDKQGDEIDEAEL